MRLCIRCDQDLPLDAFGLTRAGNHRSWCMRCHAAYKAEWKRTARGKESERRDRSQHGEARRERHQKKDPVAFATKRRTYAKRYYERNKEAVMARAAQFRREHPEVVRAHQLVRAFIFFGLLARRPCESCGKPESQAHHPDHWKPLSIVWLCARCHGRLGRDLRDPRSVIVPRSEPGTKPPSGAEGGA